MLHTRKFQLTALLVILLAAVTGYIATAQSDTADAEIIRFDVAEDGTRFVFDDAPVFEEDGYPAYGNSFITTGYIYPEGTLNGTNGVLANGKPEFPDLVIGEWICRGWFVNEGAHSETGPMVITTQIYNFDDEYGKTTLVTDGYELADLNVPVSRAITGGTGQYSAARGEAVQELLGFTENMGVTLRFEVRVQK
jgi:hypothetical protein